MSLNLRKINGSLMILRCQACQAKISIFDFEGETDTDTIGLVSAGKCNKLDVLLTELNLEEWHKFSAGQLKVLPERIQNELENEDYRLVTISRIETPASPKAGTSFAEFRKNYKPPIVFYSCPCCTQGESIIEEEMTVSRFTELGGELKILGDFVIAS